jgi:hypothetical protein
MCRFLSSKGRSANDRFLKKCWAPGIPHPPTPRHPEPSVFSWPGPCLVPPASRIAHLRENFGLCIPTPMALATAPLRPNLEHPAAALISISGIGAGVQARSERAKETWASPGQPGSKIRSLIWIRAVRYSSASVRVRFGFGSISGGLIRCPRWVLKM